MDDRNPVAFLSYVHSDDDHDNGRISLIRTRLEGEVRMHTGKPFQIFQDRNDLAWGQSWAERIEKSLNEVTFLIPVITPSYFQSPSCRKEFEIFLQREKSLGTDRLILPLYYLTTDQIEDSGNFNEDTVAQVICSRQWSDWRRLRFMGIDSPDVCAHLAEQAEMIKGHIRDLARTFASVGKGASENVAGGDARHGHPSSTPALDRPSGDPAVQKRKTARRKQLSKTRPTRPPLPALEYKIYTTKYDEAVVAADLITNDDLVANTQRITTLAAKLSNQHIRSIERAEREIAARVASETTSVSILIDNSGSMRGPKMSNTAAWALLIAELFEKVGASVEVNGFTTRAWKGGRSREEWLQEGRPPNPGRLNDVRYIIYKSFEESVIASVQNFGVMLQDRILKENIDGEALLWASATLTRRSDRRRLLIVFSDGAPVDDSTLSVQSSTYLEEHLRQAIRTVLSTDTELLAVGIEHDVSHYYGPKGIKSEPWNIGPRLFSLLRKSVVQKSAS